MEIWTEDWGWRLGLRTEIEDWGLEIRDYSGLEIMIWGFGIEILE